MEDKKNASLKAGIKQKSHRGAMDELESLRSIVSENPTLLHKVLEKIRIHKVLSMDSSPTKITSKTEAKKEPLKKDR